jgi:hypothetical protein
VSRKVNETPISAEPPCWGSGELELVPAALAGAVRGVQVSGLSVKTKSRKLSLFQPVLKDFADSAWSKSLPTFVVDNPSMTLLDVVVSSVEGVFKENPDRFDIPVFTSPLDRVDHALRIPLEIRTWDFIFGCGVETDHDMCTLLTATFREVYQRLGDVRAALDLVVTGSSWLSSNSNGSYGFVAPTTPGSFKEAVDLLRMRSFRNCGWPPGSPQYTPVFADVMGKRWSIGLEKPWTLQQCSEEMGVTRERIRQLALLVLWDSPPRLWGRPDVLESIHEQLVDSELSSVTIEDAKEPMSRKCATEVLVRFGYPAEDFEGPWSVNDELELHGIKWSKVLNVAYGESERLGLISMVELRHHIAGQFPMLVGEMFDAVIERLVRFGDLPYGYVYVESKRGSFLQGWLSKLLSVLGPLSFEETYKAIERACTVRIPRLVFPPRAVIRAFLDEHEFFWFADGVVGLQNPVQHEIDGVEKWVRDQIESCTGTVIHKTELWNRARVDGVKGGTLNVYTSYHLLFKPCGSGCITMTGNQPSPVALELAQIRAKAIRVGTRRSELSILDGVVSFEVEVGNDLLDTGVLSTSKEMRTMIENQTFKIMSAGSQHGTARWSNGMLTGFSTVLQVMGVQPGEEVVLSFDTASGDVNVKLAVE